MRATEASRGTAKSSDTALEVTHDRSTDNPRWDRFLADAPGAHHVQSTHWARVKATVGWNASRVVLQADGAIVGGCQVLWRELGGVVRVGYVPRGPLAGRDEPGHLNRLLDELAAEGRALRLAYLKLQPPVDRDDLGAVLLQRGFSSSRLDVGPSASVRIDLRRTPEELLAAMAPRVRRNLRQSDRERLVVRRGGRDDLPTFLEIIGQTAGRQGFENYPSEYWTKCWDEFAPGGAMALFLTELDGSPLSAIAVIGFGDTVIYKMGGWTGERTKARPNESMHWAAIQWARESGFRYYDLEGIQPRVAEALIAGHEPSPPPTGVAAFKLSLGGEPVLYPGTYDECYQPVRAKLARWAANRGSGHPLVRMIVGRR